MKRAQLFATFLALRLCLQTLSAGHVTALEDASEEQLIGWKGETYTRQTLPQQQQQQNPNLQQQQHQPAGTPGGNNSSRPLPPPWVETVSWQPRAFVYHGFLSPEECDHLVGLAKPKLSRSMVVGETSDLIDPIRTSFSASIGYAETPAVKDIEERVARWTHLPLSHQEPMEVLRYVNGQKYDAHWDWFDAEEVAKAGGSNRMATVVMYLADVDPSAGGETALPLAVPLDERLQSVMGGGYSECAGRMGISVRPKKGDVLLFWDMGPAGGAPDRRTLHASCPTFSGGTKWTATKWIHNLPYR